MTDREKIIKGLEKCNEYDPYCEGCPYYEIESPKCLNTMHKEALDLIKTLTKAEGAGEKETEGGYEKEKI